MGDKSPKSTRKQASQKQVKVDTTKQKKDQAEEAKQAENPKNTPKKS